MSAVRPFVVRAAMPEAGRWPLIGVPVLALIATIWPMLHELWMTSSTYSHGYLILGVAVWMVWHDFRRERPVVGRPSWLGLAFLLATACGVVLARAADVRLVQQLAVPALIVGAIWSGGGWGLAKRFVIPAGYLVFAMSIWGYLTEPLRAITTVMVGQAARLTGIPVYLVGNSIHIPAGTFEVEGGCSGLNYVVVGLALGAFSAMVHFNRWLPRILLFAAVAAISVVGNWVRVYAIVIAGHLTDMQHFLVTVDHYYFGWVLFTLMVVPVLVWAARRAPSEVSETGDVVRAVQATTPAFGARRLIAPAAALGVVALVALDAASRMSPPTVPNDSAAPRLPASIAGWGFEGEWTGETRPVFHGPTAEVSGRFAAEAGELLVYAAGYAVQSQGAELIYYANAPIPDRDIVESVERIDVTAGAERHAVRRYHVRDRDGRRRTVWIGYRVAGVPTTSDWSGKVFQALGTLFGRTDGQVFVLSMACASDCDRADGVVGEAATHFVPSLLAAVGSNLGSKLIRE